MEMSVNSPVYTSNQEATASVKDEVKAKKKHKKQGKDIYTETPLRKLGFLDEVGEALRPVLSASKNTLVQKLPNFAYIPATLYVAADVADKYKKGAEDGSKFKGVKMAAREAAFQGIVSIAAPMAIIKGVNKVTANLINKIQLPKEASQYVDKAMGILKNNKAASGFMNKAGMAGKIAGAAVALIALSKLTKPVDFITKKVFNHVVDPVLGLNKDDEV